MSVTIALTQRIIDALDYHREVIGSHGDGRLKTRQVKSGRHDWIVRDSVQRGLLVRLTPTAATYYVQRKFKGLRYLRAFANARRDGYGVFLTLPEARRHALQLIGKIAQGIDPADEYRAAQQQSREQRARESVTMRVAFADLMEAKAAKDKPSTRKDRLAVQTWMRKSPLFVLPVVDVDRDAVAASLDPIRLRALGGAHACAWGPRRVSAGSFTKTYAYCAQAWKMAMDELQIARPDPFRAWRGRVAFPKPRRRKTFIDTRSDTGQHWIRALVEWRGDVMAREHDTRWVVADCVLCMLIWGTRFAETRWLEWRNVRFDDGIIFLTEETTKSSTLGAVPLTLWATEILRTRQAADARWRPHSPFVFPGRTHGKPLTDLRGTLRVVNAAAGQHITSHDFRRTIAADIGERKNQIEAEQLAMAGVVLHHTQGRGGAISSATEGYLVRQAAGVRALYQEREDRLRELAGLPRLGKGAAAAAPASLAEIMAQIDALTQQARAVAARG